MAQVTTQQRDVAHGVAEKIIAALRVAGLSADFVRDDALGEAGQFFIGAEASDGTPISVSVGVTE